MAQKILLLFREIRLLNLIYNEMFKREIILIFVTVPTVGASATIYTLVVSCANLDMKTAIVAANSEVICIAFFLLLFRFAAKLFDSTEHFQKKVLSFGSKKWKQLMRSYYKSFSVLKMNFFENSFFASYTPLANLNFAMNLAINMSLWYWTQLGVQKNLSQHTHNHFQNNV